MTKFFQELMQLIGGIEARAVMHRRAADSRDDESWVRAVTAMTDNPDTDLSNLGDERELKAQRAAAHKRVDEKLRACFDHVLEEPVPERILQTLHERGAARDAVASQANDRTSIPGARTGHAVPLGRAVAAGLVLCVVSGFLGLAISETFLDSSSAPSLTTTLPAEYPSSDGPGAAHSDDLESPSGVESVRGVGKAQDTVDSAVLIEPGGIQEAGASAGPVTAPLEDDTTLEEGPVGFQ